VATAGRRPDPRAGVRQMVSRTIHPISPSAISLQGVRPVPRSIHFDPRGFLIETLRKDDREVRGSEFSMSYTSVTIPGEFRDRERWHHHRTQSDRFIVVMGEMILALYDSRPGSPTRGQLEVIRMEGAPYHRPSRSPGESAETHLVPIPPGVYHCIGNLSPDPFVLVNFPTELYNPEDEGRAPFRDVPIESIGGPFGWELVE
jgi:dTDP-4-dehydrorhamnose 3,5-epimerase